MIRRAFLALLCAAAFVPPGALAADVEAWFYLGRHNEAGSWAPMSRAFRLDAPKEPKRVTLLRDAVLVDNIAADAGGGNPEAAQWTRVALRGPAAIPVLEIARQDSVGQGKLVWAKVKVPEERVEVRQRR